MPDYKAYGFFTASKVGKTGLTVTADVRNPAGTLVVNNQAATEVGGGFYRYTHTTATEDDYLVTFKTADTTVDAQHVPALSALEIPRIDAATSSRLASASYIAPDNAGIAAIDGRLPADPAAVSDLANIWDYVVGGQAIKDILAALADLLSVFNKNTRNLTMTPKQIAAALDGDSVVVHRGDILTWDFADLGDLAGRTSLYLTVKSNKSAADTGATIQVKEGTGMLVLNGKQAESGQDAYASLAVTDESAGNARLTIKPQATFAFPVVNNAYYDIQVGFSADDVRTVRAGSWRIDADVTRRIS